MFAINYVYFDRFLDQNSPKISLKSSTQNENGLNWLKITQTK